VGVAQRASPSTVCVSSITTVWIFVLPRSIPPLKLTAPAYKHYAD